MPDTWTANREHLRDALQGLGAQCNVEPRVLKPRDQYWTCYLDSPSWRGDIYIHRVEDLIQSSYVLHLLVLALLSGVLIGLLWGKLFWRKGA